MEKTEKKDSTMVEADDNTVNILNQQLTNISAENQFLTFEVDNEEYGVDVLKVQEIIRYREPTAMPNAPEVIKGVINFRGEVIPVVDLRKKFNLADKEYDNFTVIIALEVKDKIVGVIVDQVSDMVSFSDEDIQENLEFGSQVDTEFIKGMARLDERLIILLYLEKLLSFEEFKAVNKVGSNLEKDSTKESEE
ncbi:chemotaxis protein CheW [Halanaerobacter jeridensis]|uniref:Chemotaxis protein CheW n=1 Tax=Halanaerobacter jeridensis TaxID=706427 RepID=A0A938XQS7_9FIRM|nr:chemotaxis protein CheW [Halanaerobacter jeridensis]MBM7555914.1 purine-binding chemotaxis protein CheW [Halanaerobacter jeridensis]